jgi:glutamate racemase
VNAPATTILVFDSGLGGLTVLSELVKARPDARFVYAADDAGFPYGPLSEDNLGARVDLVMAALIARIQPDLVVIACNTASTLVLPRLRARFAVPFVGTVPAVKPAAERSTSRIAAVLATPGTVARDYTKSLVDEHAGDCRIVLVGAARLAAEAEALLRGRRVDERIIAQEIAPCFVEVDGRRTDMVALSCTHFPLLLPQLERLSLWPVTFIDPAPAIARRVVQLLEAWPVHGLAGNAPEGLAIFTDGSGVTDELREALAERGLDAVEMWSGELD